MDVYKTMDALSCLIEIFLENFLLKIWQYCNSGIFSLNAIALLNRFLKNLNCSSKFPSIHFR